MCIMVSNVIYQGVVLSCLLTVDSIHVLACFIFQSKNVFYNGRVFTSGFSGRSASDKRKSRENSCFFNPLKVKRVGKLQWNSH